MRPLRILQVLEPGFGGVLRHVEGVLAGLRPSQHIFKLAYSTARASQRLESLLERLHLDGIETLNLTVSNSPGWADLQALKAIAEFARDVDIIHGHSSKAGALARIVGLGTGKKVFYTPNAYYGLGAKPGVKTRFYNAAETVLGQIGWTVHVSPDEMEFARRVLRLPASRQILLPNGVDCETFRPATDDQRLHARRRFGIPQDALVLGSLGRLCYQKDPETLYQAVAQLAKDVPSLVLLHLGEGELESELELLRRELKLCPNLVRVPFLLDTLPFYHALDGFILTSRFEGLPFSALEALAANLPLILSRAPGHGMFSKVGLSHVFFGDIGDPESFSKACYQWLAALETHPQRNHRSVAEKHFSLKQRNLQLLAHYERVAYQ